jgi:peptidoglycan/LPS O-acetylase OafA/YrhL
VIPRFHLMGPEETSGLVSSQTWYWSYLANVLTARAGWEGTPALTFHFWSLAIEEQFYLVWPLLIWLLPERRLKLACVGAMLGSFLLRLALRAAGESGVVSYVLTPTHVDPLAAGAWLAVVAREPHGLTRLSREVRPALALSVTAVALIFLTAHGKVVNSLGMEALGYPVLALGCAAAVVSAITSAERSLGGRLWRSSVMGYLGRRSYAIYVLHPLTLFLVIHWGYDVPWFAQRFGSQLEGQAVFATIMVALSAGVAYLSWHGWEQPFLRLKSRFPMVERRDGDRSQATGSSSGLPGIIYDKPIHGRNNPG